MPRLANPETLTLATPLIATQTYWADPWLITTATQRGTRKADDGMDSEDAVLVARCGRGAILAIADGIGSTEASLARMGAHRAVVTAATYAQHLYPIEGATENMLMSCLAAAHIDLTTLARQLNKKSSVLSTTLLLAFLIDDRIVAARIGDGSLFTWDTKRLTPFCSADLPPDGTTPITLPDWRRWATTMTSERDFIQGFAMCTDGAHKFFFEAQGGYPKPSPYALEWFSKTLDTDGYLAAPNVIYRMLSSKAHLTTGDDRTFIMALKPQSPNANPNARLPG